MTLTHAKPRPDEARRAVVPAAMAFARDLLGGEASAHYRIDDRHELHDFRMDEKLEAFHRAYVAELHVIDPFHARRLHDGAVTICCLSRDLEARSSPEIRRYAAACADHGIGDMVELIFRRDGQLVSGLSVVWRPGRRADDADLARAAAAHTYMEVTLAALGVPQGGQVLARAGLTQRETEVVDLICAGRTNRDIADILDIGLPTVKTHVLRIFEKLGVENRASVVALVARG